MTAKNTQKNGSKKEMAVEDMFKSMTQHEHILKIPDTYIGGIQEDDAKMWIYDEDTNTMVYKNIKYIPGLYKIFDETIVNARDNTIRDPTCNKIMVDINEADGTISCWNNGENGIPIVIHQKEKCYVHEMLFSRILTSGNYEKQGKFVGGKNGIGSKATNIYSDQFEIEGIDSKRKLKFYQKFQNNMYLRHEPVILKLTGKLESSLRITFKPDFQRFGVDKLSKDIISLFKKRIYDIAAITSAKVYLNGEIINIGGFKNYIEKFYENGEIPNEIIYDEMGTVKVELAELIRWKVGVIYDPNCGYRQISYVNGIYTSQGGSHVNHIVDQIVGALNKVISDKNKNIQIKSSTIKDNLTFFIDCNIEDPAFASQSKELLTSKVASFVSKYEVNEDFIKKLSKTGIVEEVVNFAKYRAMEDMKKLDGKKTPTLKGINKLDDAHWAGTRKSVLTRLILTEGDSAKNFAVNGTEIIGKDRYGVFPLKGKLLNVREATAYQLIHNEEIKNIIKIMGLKYNKKYKDTKQLRYGGIIILTDQDYDGAHIKGLLMNFIHFFWPSLIHMNGFVQSIKTPIVKVWKKSDVKKANKTIFYTMTEFYQWRNEIGEGIKNWTDKYYKGLGTSTPDEAKEAFIAFENKIITYTWDVVNQNNNEHGSTTNEESLDNNEEDNNEEENCGIEGIEGIEGDDNSEVKSDVVSEDGNDKESLCHDAITLAFEKKRADDRKKWLKDYDKNIILDTSQQNVSYYDFIHKDLIHFSNYDNIRSLPAIDGFKPSLRKILYACFLRKIFKEEIKVSQLSGFVSDKTNYHHGEASLQGAIIGMAQCFVGSNNLFLLLPNGDFGNRRMGGKNSASARYIFTQLNELTPLIFRNEDNCIYDYSDEDGNEDGKPSEPTLYAPITCMLLINGSEGIGTGFSTKISSFNPLDINKNLRLLINGKSPIEMKPWYRGFKGKIVMTGKNTYESVGLFEIIDEHSIIIEELPIGTWTDDYKAFLDSLVVDDIKNPKKGQILKNFKDDSGNDSIKFTLTFLDDILQDFVKKNEIEKKLKLINKHSMNNMNMYDSKGSLRKFSNVNDILTEFYEYRLEMYVKRKEYYLKQIENELNILGWKIKFLELYISGEIEIIQKKVINGKEIKLAREEDDVLTELKDKHMFPMLSRNPFAAESEKSYDYVTDIGIFTITPKRKQKLENDYDNKMNEFKIYKNTPVQKIWLSELDEFEKCYNKWIENISDILVTKSKKTTKKSKSKSKGKK